MSSITMVCLTFQVDLHRDVPVFVLLTLAVMIHFPTVLGIGGAWWMEKVKRKVKGVFDGKCGTLNLRRPGRRRAAPFKHAVRKVSFRAM